MPPPIRNRRNQGFGGRAGGKANKARNAHTTNNRLRLTQQYAEVVGIGAVNNRLRLSQQYVEVIIAEGIPSRSYGSVV